MTRFVPALGGAVVVMVAAALALNFYFNQPSVGGPDVDPRSSFLGTWVNTTDADGGTQTMTVRAAEGGAVEIVVVDDIATVCSGGPSTMTGTGHLEGSTKFVIPAPVYTCDDGTEARALSGPPLAEQLRNLTFVYHPETDTLSLGSDLEAVWQRQNEPELSPGPSASPPSEAEVTALLNAFLQARIAGEGAQEHLHSLYPEILWEDIPLLYATSSGAPYERAEFEPVSGIEWPYGFMAFKVRLFAGDTVVEQLFFMPHDDPQWFPADGRLGLEYQPDGFGTDIPPTTENGQPFAVAYTFLDGAVTLHAAHPWIMFDYGPIGRLIPEGPGVPPTTDGAQRHDGWDLLFLVADPMLIGTDCQGTSSPADAQALADSIRSYPGAEATAPVAASVGGAKALMMDVVIAAGTTITVPADDLGNLCQDAVLYPVFDQDTVAFDNGVATGVATGDRMRLYLVDAPVGLSMRILAIAIVAPESRFERAVEAAAPVVDSVAFHAP